MTRMQARKLFLKSAITSKTQEQSPPTILVSFLEESHASGHRRETGLLLVALFTQPQFYEVRTNQTGKQYGAFIASLALIFRKVYRFLESRNSQILEHLYPVRWTRKGIGCGTTGHLVYL